MYHKWQKNTHNALCITWTGFLSVASPSSFYILTKTYITQCQWYVLRSRLERACTSLVVHTLVTSRGVLRRLWKQKLTPTVWYFMERAHRDYTGKRGILKCADNTSWFCCYNKIMMSCQQLYCYSKAHWPLQATFTRSIYSCRVVLYLFGRQLRQWQGNQRVMHVPIADEHNIFYDYDTRCMFDSVVHVTLWHQCPAC